MRTWDKFLLLFSTRSKHVFAKDKLLHKLACFGTAIDVLYRIKRDRKKEASVAIFDRFIKPNSVCIDVGAAYGRLTYDIGRLAYNGKVYSFEPEVYSYQVMKYLMMLLGYKHVTTVNNAVFDKVEEIILKVPLKSNGKYAPHLGHVGNDEDIKEYLEEKVNTVVIDEYAKENNVNKVDFIKCDIEGGELFVLKGAQDLINKARPVIFCEVIDTNLAHFGLSFQDIQNYLKENRFKSYVYEGNKLQEQEVGSMFCDYFFVPEEKHY